MNEEDVKNFFGNIHKQYFNEYFANKFFIEPIIFDHFKDAIFSLMAAQVKFILLSNSLKQIEDDEKFYKSYPDKNKETLENCITSLDWIIDTITQIIEAFMQGMVD